MGADITNVLTLQNFEVLSEKLQICQRYRILTFYPKNYKYANVTEFWGFVRKITNMPTLQNFEVYPKNYRYANATEFWGLSEKNYKYANVTEFWGFIRKITNVLTLQNFEVLSEKIQICQRYRI
jgi:hypothetical protein